MALAKATKLDRLLLKRITFLPFHVSSFRFFISANFKNLDPLRKRQIGRHPPPKNACKSRQPEARAMSSPMCVDFLLRSRTCSIKLDVVKVVIAYRRTKSPSVRVVARLCASLKCQTIEIVVYESVSFGGHKGGGGGMEASPREKDDIKSENVPCPAFSQLASFPPQNNLHTY